jgi:hypothetical protein
MGVAGARHYNPDGGLVNPGARWDGGRPRETGAGAGPTGRERRMTTPNGAPLDQVRTLGETIEHADQFEALVTPAVAGQLVTLWSPKDKALIVAAEHANELIAEYGFRRDYADVEATAAEARLLFDAARDAFERFVAGVVSDGVLDPNDDAAYLTATTAIRQLDTTVQRAMTAIHHKYPVKQVQEQVEMVDWQGGVHPVDVKSAEHHHKIGWTYRCPPAE